MKKKIVSGVAVAAVATLGFGVPSASAAHCVEGDSPGFSYFGKDHNKAHAGNEGNQGPHSPGASSCREQTGSPSERAPGQNK